MRIESKRKTKWIAMLLSMMMTVAVVFPSVTVSAASYEGKGTKAQPYLVKTAEQLQGMADNLSAHYKLANTIDLSSVSNFKPIGNLAKPFTGSFTCDKDSDGTPKYAIKNLKIYNNAGEKYGHKVGVNNYLDYKEKNSNWEAALFGSAKGANFTNIALLNVNITNTVVGQNKMNGDWSLNPGQDEQATAALIALADGVTIDNCSSTGTINSKSNNSAGLVGRLNNGTVRNSYSQVNIKSSGLWGHGGLIGVVKGGTISNCFATGNVESSAHISGGFVGTGSGKIENCYSTGNVSSGFSFHETESGTTITLKNCAALGKGTNSRTYKGNSNASGCLVNSAGGLQSDFTAVSASEVQALINSIKGQIKVISNTSKYVPGTVDISGATEQTGNDNATSGDQAGDGNVAVEEQVKALTAEELMTLVKDLDKKLFEGKVTWEEALQCVTIKDTYLNMTDEEKAKVDEATVNMLNSIYDKGSIQAVTLITKELKKLPKVDEVDGENAEVVLNIKKMYDALPEGIQQLLDAKKVKQLETCYEKAKSYENVSVVTQEVDSAVSEMERVLIIVLLAVQVLLFAGFVVLVIFNVKTLRDMKGRKKGAASSAKE